MTRRLFAALVAAFFALTWAHFALATSPTVPTSCNSTEAVATTSHDVCIPTGTGAGDLLIALEAYDTNPTITPPSGWTLITGTSSCSGAFAGSGGRLSCFYHIADGTEGSTVTFTSSLSVESAHLVLRIEGHGSTTNAPFSGTASGATSASPNPGAVTPTGGAADYLIVEIVGYDEDDSATASSGYTGLTKSSSSAAASGVSVFAGYLAITATATEDPAAMTLGASQEHRAVAVAVYPGSEGVTSATAGIDNTATMALLLEGGNGRTGTGGGSGVTTVSSTDDVQAVINTASAGDVISFNSGTYKQSLTIPVEKSNLTLIAATPGGAIIDCGTTSTFTWTASGSNWQASVGYNPGMVVIDDPGIVLFPLSASVSTRGFTYSAGTVTLRTSGINPNSATISVGDATRTTGILVQADNVVIDGFEFRACRDKGVKIDTGADNVTVRQNAFIGFGYGVDCGLLSRNSNPTIEKNAFSNYPLYRDSVSGAVGDTGTVGSEEWKWGQIYATQMPGMTAGNAGSHTEMSEVAAITCGASGADVKENIVWDSFDCLQPRKSGAGKALMEWYRNVAIDCRDDTIELDEFGGGENIRLAFGVNLNGKSNCLADSTIIDGPAQFDHYICQRALEAWASVADDGLQHGWMFKFRSPTQGEPTNNSTFTHLTIIGLNNGSPDVGLDCCGPAGGSGNTFANSIIDMPGESNLTLNSFFTSVSNCTTTTPGFVATAPFDYDLQSGATCRNGGSTTWDLNHNASDSAPNAGATDGNPDRGAIESGVPWALLAIHVGPDWFDPTTDFPSFALPTSIDADYLGIH